MTSKIIVNNVGADAGITSVHFDSNIQRGISNLHSTGLNVTDTFLHSTGLNLTSDSSINIGTGATISQPATNSLALGTNSSERLRIGPAGQIGLSGANYGTSGQVLKSGGPSAAPTWGANGKFASYAIICDQKSSNTAGGTFTTGAWQTRDLNTEISDPDGIVSISSNKFTLAAGTYLIKASAPGHRVNAHVIRLYNDTDSATVVHGTSEWSHNSYATTTRSFLSTRFTISGTKVFEIQHRCSTTYNTIGYGRVSTFGNTETFTLVEIYKEAS